MSEDGSTPTPRRKRRILGLDDQQRQAQRRTLVLDAALELFGTRGYAKTSIELLCQTAGIGTNSFYDLFPHKEAVLVGLYDRISEQLVHLVADAYLTHHDQPDFIRALVAAFVHGTVDDPRIARVAFFEAAGVSDQVEEHRRTTRNAFVDRLITIGRDIRDTDPHAARIDEARRPGPSPRRNAVAIVGAIVETTIDWLLDPDPDPIDHLIDDITHHCRRVVNAIIQDSATSPEGAPAPPT